ncbi:2-dehydro-3-deoxygalactonokinase [Thioclava sp. BHET1]|nr:2-dehydro-3-deoxygalactonokinase [Thioclava sp. BHET1]
MTDWTALVEEAGRWRALAVDETGAIRDQQSGPSPRPLLPEGTVVLAATAPGLERRTLPCAPLPEGPWPRAEISERALPALPGLVQTRPDETVTPPEAARIAGILAGMAQFDGVIWICGATSLWAHISAGEIVSVTRMGSAAMLAGLGAPLHAGEEFDAALSDALSRPERMARDLGALALSGRSERAAGAVLGAELAATRPWWLGQPVLALSSPTAPGWAEICQRALQSQGAQVTLGDGEAALIAGLAQARKQ